MPRRSGGNLIPTSKLTPEPRAHDGFEGIYVLSGQMRLVLGDRDKVLEPGEVATFDTQVPHWFGSTGKQLAEILSIFGRLGERMNVPTESPADLRAATLAGALNRCASALYGAIWTTAWGCRAPQVVRLTPFSPDPRGSRLS
jgi:hypothetical protein